MEIVSIICPVYNSEKYLPFLIESILKQSYPFFECQFIDDCSIDNSLNLITNLTDNRFNVISNKTNQGAQKCREIGYKNCKGEYIVFIDSDDYLEKDYLVALLNQLKTDESDLVMCNYKVVDENNQFIRFNKSVTPIKEAIFPLYASNNPVVIISKPAFWNKMFRLSFLKSHLFFPDVLVGQDLSIMPVLFSKAKISYVDKVLYNYRILSNSISNSYDERLLHITKIINVLNNNLAKSFFDELEFIAIGHYFYQISKTIYINDKKLRLNIYQKLINSFFYNFPNYKKNKYFKKRFFYKLYITILKWKLLYSNEIIRSIFIFLLSKKIIVNFIRKSDK